MQSLIQTGLTWLCSFLPEPTTFQKKIFVQWIYRLLKHYQSITNYKLSVEYEFWHSFLLRKTLYLLFPHYNLMSSPFELPDMVPAVNLLNQAIRSKESTRILFYGDRDVDGITSASILYLFLRDTAKYPPQNLMVLVPRENDKYGITNEVVDRLLSYQFDILVTLDCGSSNKDTLEHLQERTQASVIIVDHHFLPQHESDFPNVLAFINPKKLHLTNHNTSLSTSGIAFKLIWALLYSFHSEYDSIFNIQHKETEFHIKNGIILERIDIEDRSVTKRIVFDALKSSAKEQDTSVLNGDLFWKSYIKLRAERNRLELFLKHLPILDSLRYKVNILTMDGMRNIYNKVRPYLVLAALGTTADIMPLVDDNRIFLAEALSFINSNAKDTPNGVRALLHAYRINVGMVTEQDFSFTLCPAINAACRLGKAEISLDLMCEVDLLVAYKKASKLKRLNEERKKLSSLAYKKIEAFISKEKLDNEFSKLICIYDDSIHRGISGLIANQLAEKFQRPTIVLVNDYDTLRGSIRAYKNEDVFSLIVQLKDYFIDHGGHRQAAGFSMLPTQLDAFRKTCYNLLEKHDFFANSDEDEESERIEIDDAEELLQPIEIDEANIDTSLWQEFNFFAPFGELHPLPKVIIHSVGGISIKPLGNHSKHAKVILHALHHKNIEGIWFFHSSKVDQMQTQEMYKVHAEPFVSSFQGIKRYQLKIKDIL